MNEQQIQAVISNLAQKIGVLEANLAISAVQNEALQAEVEALRETPQAAS